MKRLNSFIFLLFCGFNFSSSAQAFDIPENKNLTILDNAGVFDSREKLDLQNIIREIERKTTVEVAILTTRSLHGYPISQLAVEVGRQWGVGQKENDNGLVLIIAVADHDWFMATGYGLEGTLPDILVKRVGEKYFPVNFRREDYAGGVKRVLKDVQALLEKDPTVIAQYKTIPKTTLWIIHGLVALLLFSISVYQKREHLGRAVFSSLFITFHFLFLAGTFLFSTGLVAYFFIVLFYSLFAFSTELKSGGSSDGFGGSGGWSSGGGFSSGGFGGGSFGGGGGGGSW